MNQRTFKKTVPFGIQIKLLMMIEAIQTRTVPCTIMQARMRGAPAVMRVSAREVSDSGERAKQHPKRCGAHVRQLRKDRCAQGVRSCDWLLLQNLLAQGATTKDCKNMKKLKILLIVAGSQSQDVALAHTPLMYP